MTHAQAAGRIAASAVVVALLAVATLAVRTAGAPAVDAPAEVIAAPLPIAMGSEVVRTAARQEPSAPPPVAGPEAWRGAALPSAPPEARATSATEPELESQPEPQPEVEPEPEPATTLVVGRQPGAILPVLDPDTIEGLAERTGIPSRALAAYASAAHVLEQEQPACGVTWSTLAAIGWVESHHGNFRTAQLREDGYPSEPIIGIPLDGGPNVRAIRDTDGGRYDGDPVWDRAVGPMQFIPSTWARWGADGNGDGVADPQHIDDAALAAARYLCASGGDLTQASGWWGATLSYNRSESYARHVLEVANTYARRSHG